MLQELTNKLPSYVFCIRWRDRLRHFILCHVLEAAHRRRPCVMRVHGPFAVAADSIIVEVAIHDVLSIITYACSMTFVLHMRRRKDNNVANDFKPPVPDHAQAKHLTAQHEPVFHGRARHVFQYERLTHPVEFFQQSRKYVRVYFAGIAVPLCRYRERLAGRRGVKAGGTRELFLQVKRHYVSLYKPERVAWLRIDVDADNVESCPVVTNRRAAVKVNKQWPTLVVQHSAGNTS